MDEASRLPSVALGAPSPDPPIDQTGVEQDRQKRDEHSDGDADPFAVQQDDRDGEGEEAEHDGLGPQQCPERAP